ncbi:MAG: peptidoglycan editing factor PgeF [Rhodocyclaceae bacterium]|nr:peptidoglycan editing factor PgeF [Rhodocyclaceae bacterium]
MSLDQRDCILPDWPAPPSVRSLITTRAGGISQGCHASLNLGKSVGDDPVAVEENRRRVVNLIGATPRWMSQVHGIEVANLDKIRPDAAISADAAVSRRRRSVCTVMMADCLSLLLCDRDGTTVAAAHAGWRGLAAGVLEAAIASMHVPPENLLAYMGPAIGAEAFEVGAEVRQRFLAAARPAEQLPVSAAFVPKADAGDANKPSDDAVRTKWHANIYALAETRLLRAGLRPSAVYGGGLCTFSDSERFFSHRRGIHQGQSSGRMAAMIWLD